MVTSNFVPAVDDTTEIIGILLLFIPYIIILLPFLQNKIVLYFQSLYLHRTPRDDWNNAVDQHPPRRLLGYIFSILFTFTAIWLLLIKNYYNNYWLDFFQYFIYLSLPLIVSIIRPPSHRPCDIFDFMIILLIIIPIEISQKYDSFLPDITFKIYNSWKQSPNISILRLTGYNLFLFIFFIFRPLNNIGLGWDITNNNYYSFKWILLRFISIIFIFLLLSIPFCLIPSIKYLHSSSKMNNVWIDGIARFFCLFFLEILIFEFVYRGIIQNLLHSAISHRYEARSYLHGGERINSLTDILNQFDETTDDSEKEVLGVIKIVDNTKSINYNKIEPDTVDIKSLPYFEGDSNNNDNDSDDASTMIQSSYLKKQRDTISCSMGICYFLRFDYLRDWFIIIISSIIYSLTIIDYKHNQNTKDLIYAAILMFWLGFCCGWLYKLTNSCFISAVFNTFIIFNFKYVFNPNTDFCNGAC